MALRNCLGVLAGDILYQLGTLPCLASGADLFQPWPLVGRAIPADVESVPIARANALARTGNPAPTRRPVSDAEHLLNFHRTCRKISGERSMSVLVAPKTPPRFALEPYKSLENDELHTRIQAVRKALRAGC